MKRRLRLLIVLGLAVSAIGVSVMASSHREAPGITETPKLDGTDFYMFRSYESGRSDYITLLANYVPLQDVYGGPNFFTMDSDALYEINVDNDGDAREDITFQFRFQNIYKNIAIPVGGKNIGVPLINVGAVGPGTDDTSNLNVIENYTVDIIRGKHRGGHSGELRNMANGNSVFRKPVDRIGDKSLPDYNTYANNHIYDVDIPGCNPGRLFVGQRREGFVVNLSEAFDLINLNPLGSTSGEPNTLASKNVTTLALEVPISCIVANDPVIGAWTTASKDKQDSIEKDDRQDKDNSLRRPAPEGRFVQVSRLGNPLVNELVIGIKDKNKFNRSEPKEDLKFLDYVTNPTLPALVEALFSVPAPATPRLDLVAVFLVGVPGLNMPAGIVPSEMLRLNTSIAPTTVGSQNPIGVINGDLAGFPNGRRPGDDVVDIALRAVEGALLATPPSSFPAVTDGAFIDAQVAYAPNGSLSANSADRLFRDSFPYLEKPLSGSPAPTHP